MSQSVNPNWHNYSTNIVVTDIEIIGSDLWAGTIGGLSRLNLNTSQVDVFNFTNSGLRSNQIFALDKDDSGNLWVGSSCLVKYDGNTWTTYDLLPTGDTLKEVRYVCVDRFNNVWFASMNIWFSNFVDAFFKYDGTTFTKFSAPVGQIYGLSPDTLGNIWMVSSLGLTKFDGLNYIVFDSTNSPSGLNAPLDVKVDELNNKWVMNYNSMSSSTIYKFNDVTWDSLSVPFGRMYISDDNHVWLYSDSLSPIVEINDTIISSHNAPLSIVYSFIKDSTGHYWAGVGSNYLLGDKSRLHEFDGSAWIKYDVSDTPIGNTYIPLIKLGPNQSVWFHADGAGIMKFKDSVWTSYTTNNSGLNSDRIWDLEIDNLDRLWTISGLWSSAVINLFDGNLWQVIPIPQGFSPWQIESDNYNNVWVAFNNGNGLGYFDGAAWVLYNTLNSGLLDNNASMLKSDKFNRIWMQSLDNLQMFDGNTWTTYSSMNSPFVNFNNYYVDNSQNLWVFDWGTTYRYDGITWYTIPNASVGLPVSIQSFSEDSLGNFWFSTENGLFKYDGIQYTRFSPFQLPSPYFSFEMVIDSLNNIWATNNGLSVFNENGVNIPTGINIVAHIPNELIIYPNPVDENLIILGIDGEGELTIFNSLGQEVYYQIWKSESLGEIVIDVSELKPDLYVLSFTNQKGFWVKKFLKNKFHGQ